MSIWVGVERTIGGYQCNRSSVAGLDVLGDGRPATRVCALLGTTRPQCAPRMKLGSVARAAAAFDNHASLDEAMPVLPEPLVSASS
jgi:hypothetical protein